MLIITIVAALALQIGRPGGGASQQSQQDYERNLQQRLNEQADKGPPQMVPLHTPDASDLQKVYPADALAKNLAGQATLRCTIDKTGAFSRCRVLDESPAKAGFGAAALELSKVFKFDTKASDGSSVVGESLTMPIKFNPDQAK